MRKQHRELPTAMNRREFLTTALRAGTALLAQPLLPGVTAMAQDAPRQPLRFAMITDVHLVGYLEKDGRIWPRLPEYAWWALSRRFDIMPMLLPRAMNQVQDQHQPAFLVFGGDQTDDGTGVQGQADQDQFKAVAEKHGRVPLKYVYGNHDGPQDGFKQRFGALDYHFDVGEVRFVVLNSGSMDWHAEESSSSAAYSELQQALATAENRRVIVLLHQWVYPATVEGYSIRRAEEMMALLEQYPRTVAVINGHYHTGKYGEKAGIHCFTAKSLTEPPFCYTLFELSDTSLTCVEYTLSTREKAFVPGKPLVLALRA